MTKDQKDRKAFELAYQPNPKKSPFPFFRFNEETNLYEGYSFDEWEVKLVNAAWWGWQERSKTKSELIAAGDELQSWVAHWSFRAKNDGENYIVVDANLLAKKIEKLTGANA